MKNLIPFFIMLCSCGVTRDLNEYESLPAMLVRVERVERFSEVFSEMRVMQKKQTWEFLKDHYKIFRYVDTTNREEIGIVALRDRRK